MSRTGLCIALIVAAVVGVVFGLYPELDLKLQQPFFDPARDGFWVRGDRTFLWLRDLSTYLVTLIALVPVFALLIKVILPQRRLMVPGRAVVLMLATLVLAPGIVTNAILKDYWGRSRPIDVPQFGGDEAFVPWWDPRGVCPKNCSFVAGEPSGAFWTLAPAALMPPQWRGLAYGAGVAFGASVGLLRMAGGGHFFTDVVFSGVFTFLIIWLVHGLLYRWSSTRITDAAVERALERLAMPGHHLIVRVLTRLGVLSRDHGADGERR